jgi:hypothetical protein
VYWVFCSLGMGYHSSGRNVLFFTLQLFQTMEKCTAIKQEASSESQVIVCLINNYSVLIKTTSQCSVSFVWWRKKKAQAEQCVICSIIGENWALL